jgi:hypothetical protein
VPCTPDDHGKQLPDALKIWEKERVAEGDGVSHQGVGKNHIITLYKNNNLCISKSHLKEREIG